MPRLVRQHYHEEPDARQPFTTLRVPGFVGERVAKPEIQIHRSGIEIDDALLQFLTPEERAELDALLVHHIPYVPTSPTARQAAFLSVPHQEALFGGSAGGGKSTALLMAALEYVNVPNYAALLLRRTYRDLSLPGALIDKAHQWLGDTDAKWSETNKTWLFPSGAQVAFGYLESEADKFRYQSSEFQFIGFDELTQFSETQYRYLFSRLRRLKNGTVPLRMRGATNPGGVGHEWVRRRFIDGEDAADRAFVPARLSDNPHLDQEAYLLALDALDPITRAQLKDGDWSMRAFEGKLRREWFKIVDAAPAAAISQVVRYWDIASTEPAPGRDPDWTVGAKLVEQDGVVTIVDIRRARTSPKGVEQLVRQTAEMDGVRVPIWMEQEPGSSGKQIIDHFRRNVLFGFEFRESRTTGTKELRANPFAAAAEAGNVLLLRGGWNDAFLDEVDVFPHGAHDDQVDACSGAFTQLVQRHRMTTGRLAL